ncbi:MAG TPA: Ig-like domain-containing protein [Gemmatimonadales bacterium]|nr:Ig-like domain-containing protein [Gemmatimonadales bacterium]
MKGLCGFVAFALAGVVGVVACSNSSEPSGPHAASVTAISGDSQVVPTGAQLAFPLSMVLLGSNGTPVQGVTVTWTASPANEVTIAPPTSTSDANGTVTTNVTAGTTPDTVTISAAVPGVQQAVVFHALVVNPCAYLAPAALGQTINGALATTDCNYQGRGWYYDFYLLSLPAGQQSVSITMNSTAFDTYVDLWNAAGPYVGFDDDVVLQQVQNSQLDIILPGDNYIIGANSFDMHQTGAYALSAVTRPATLNGCRQVWVTRGVSVTDAISGADCADSAATPHHYDVARIIALTGTVLTMSVHSAAMNPAIALYSVSGANYDRTLAVANDDSASGNQTAYISYAVPASAVFDVLISGSSPTDSGAYTFAVSSSTTASPPVSAPVRSGRWGWHGGVTLPTDPFHLTKHAKT